MTEKVESARAIKWQAAYLRAVRGGEWEASHMQWPANENHDHLRIAWKARKRIAIAAPPLGIHGNNLRLRQWTWRQCLMQSPFIHQRIKIMEADSNSLANNQGS